MSCHVNVFMHTIRLIMGEFCYKKKRIHPQLIFWRGLWVEYHYTFRVLSGCHFLFWTNHSPVTVINVSVWSSGIIRNFQEGIRDTDSLPIHVFRQTESEALIILWGCIVVFPSSIIIENQSIAGIIQALDYKIFILINRFIFISVEIVI
jgi:hypothetical protein